MRRFVLMTLVAAGAVALTAGPAPAWNRAGHMVTGAIAYRTLEQDSPEALARIVALLKMHPDYNRVWKEEIERPGVPENERDLCLFMIAGRWADDARGNSQYYPASEHRDRWHYINFPYRPAGEPESVKTAPPDDINILWAFNHNYDVMTGKKADAERAVAAAWLFHLVGDVHQPLHTSSLFTRQLQDLDQGKPTGDRGGNRISVRVTKESQTINLHAFWDGLVIGSTRFQEVRNRATELRNRPDLARDKLTELATPGFEKWAFQESFQLAQKAVYLEGKLTGGLSKNAATVLPPDYPAASKAVAERRVVLAGYRIAEVMKRAFGSNRRLPKQPALRRIAFGSCAQQERPQPIWKAIVDTKPDFFLFIGDNIYGDTKDPAVLRKKYAKLAAVPGYQQLLKTCPILATWDDHDYGQDDAGAENPIKDMSQQIFLDFFGVAKDSPRRQQKGVYSAEVFGPPEERVQVILLDTRYFRSPLKKRGTGGRYVPNNDTTTTFLGPEQWKWLEGQLRVPAKLRLICSSIQVVSEDHEFEKWMNMPHERERLYKLLKDTGAGGVVFLSGDRHLAELSLMDGGVGYPMYDLTSSGLNQGSKAWRPQEANKHRVATMNQGNNFGLITIDWAGKDTSLTLQIRDEQGEITIRQRLALSLLQPGSLKSKKK